MAENELKLYTIPAPETGDQPATIASVEATVNDKLQNLDVPVVVQQSYLKSQNFVSGSSGWKIDSQGNLEANNGNFRGDITGASGTFSGTITATAGSIGGFNIGSDYVRDVANSMGMASTVTGADDVRFWAGDTFANRATAEFRVTEAGALTATSATITGALTTSAGSSVDGQYLATASVAPASVNIAMRGWTQTSAFSVTDADTVSWGSGTFTAADGTAYSISGGNTGNMVAKTYIYLDIGVSTTAYQTTTTATTAVGSGKVLVAVAQNGTGEATFSVLSGQGGQNIDAANIVAGSITANEIATSTITADRMSVSDLSAISANIGTITSGSISVITGGNTVALTPGSATAFASGPTGSPTVTITQAGVLTATGAVLNGYTVATQGTFGGDGSDGALAITSGTTTLSFASASFLVKNYSSISITSTGQLATSNPSSTGSALILRSQGAVTLTASAPCITVAGMGADGGTAVTSNATTDGNDGTGGNVVVFKSNFGGKASGGAVAGTGGSMTINSVQYPSSFDQNLNRYPLLLTGSGGGSGCNNQVDVSRTSGAGGKGGGTLVIECAGAWNFTTASGISVAGNNGGNATGSLTASASGGGGGGSGGVLLALYNTLTANTGTVVTSGGTGGNCKAAGGVTAAGGGGGALLSAGSNGTTSTTNNAKTGGDGAAGISTIAKNGTFA